MTYKLLALLIATLSGSIHCGSMCGGLGLSVGPDRKLQSVYQGARLLAYLLLGALAGGAGTMLLSHDLLDWVAAISSFLLSVYLIFSGVYLLKRGRPVEIGSWILSPLVPGILKRGHAFSPFKRAFLIGMFTPFLPCAWLMTSVVLAVNSGSTGTGALILLAVWLGSLPALIAGPAAFRHLVNNVHQRGRQVIAVLLVVTGLFSVFYRANHGSSHDPRMTQDSGPIPACLPAWGIPESGASRYSMPAD
jgi:sulfite exporter TauE/SafE